MLLWLLSSIVLAEESILEVPAVEPSEKTPVSSSGQDFAQALQEQRWNDAEAIFSQIAEPSFVQLQQGAECAVQLGLLQNAYSRYLKAFSKKFTREEPRNFRLIESKTVFVTLEGEGILILEGEAETILLRAIDTANQELQKEKHFAGRLPLGLYRFQEGGYLITKASAEKIDQATLERMLAIEKEKESYFSTKIVHEIDSWLIEPTSYRARAGLHTHFFGSETADIAMQSFWSVGPTLGMIWTKRKGDWGLGLESNTYISASPRAFMFGVNGSAFGEYALPKGYLLAGWRYDFSVGRVVGVKLSEQIGTVTATELDSLAIAGVALSMGLWTEYRYPIKEKIDVYMRLGFRNDGKRMYFDGDMGAVFPLPF